MATKRKSKKAEKLEFRPHKITGQLIGAYFNEKGEIVGEEFMGEVQIHKANFGDVDRLIGEAVAQSEAAKQAESEG